ncbi:ABC transporter permease [Paraoerskovia marina]|uniref:ABC transporter permease n=1 Tax=Paraoerskovia marina TaxID=545619 RepID=UPI000B042B70|nr:ABC transporter permease [Paraoerskovia marina]
MTTSTYSVARNGPEPGGDAVAAGTAAAVPVSTDGTSGGTDGPPSPRPTTRRRTMDKKSRLRLLNAFSIVMGIATWWVMSLAGFQFPTPPEVVAKAGEMWSSGILQEDILASLGRVLTGFLIGSALAIPVGFLMGWYTVARGLFEPWIQFFRTIPPLALLPLVLVLMGIGELPKVFVIFLAAFLACVISTYQGVVGVDKTLINAARVLGAKDGRIFARVVVPASTPFILVGMRVGLGSAWATLVAAELLAAQAGLGYRMQQAQLYYDLATIFVDIIAIGILGLVMDRLLLLAETKLTGWQERR